MGETFTFTRYTAGWDDTDGIMQDCCYVIDRAGAILDPDIEERLEGTDYQAGRVVFRETYNDLSTSALAVEIIEYRNGKVEWKLIRHPRPQTPEQLIVLDTLSDMFNLKPRPYGYGFREVPQTENR